VAKLLFVQTRGPGVVQSLRAKATGIAWMETMVSDTIVVSAIFVATISVLRRQASLTPCCSVVSVRRAIKIKVGGVEEHEKKEETEPKNGSREGPEDLEESECVSQVEGDGRVVGDEEGDEAGKGAGERKDHDETEEIGDSGEEKSSWRFELDMPGRRVLDVTKIDARACVAFDTGVRFCVVCRRPPFALGAPVDGRGLSG
jgi:hypothetical protein